MTEAGDSAGGSSGGPTGDAAAEAGGSSRPAAPFVRSARVAIPWIVAAVCLVWVFRVVPFEACVAALRRARLALFLPAAVGAVVLWFTIESAAYAYTFSRFNTRVRWREARSIRALSYLLTVVHWHLAKAAVVLRLHTTHGVGLVAATSTLLLYQMIGLLTLALLTGAGAIALRFSAAGFSRTPVAPESVLVAAGLLAAGMIAALLLLRFDRPRLPGLATLRAIGLFASHRRVSWQDVFVIGAAKVAYQLVFVGVYAIGLRAFGLSPSLSHVMVATAILQAIGGIPISPAGFGTQQAAMLVLFSDPAANGSDGPAILAFGFSLPITTMVVRALLACLYLGDLRDTTGSSSSATTRV
jgi:Lysylphosphatidylglycerol synthase TM region